MQRRSLLGLGLAGGLALAAAGAGVAWVSRTPAWRQGQLSPDARVLLSAVAVSVLDGSLPADTGPAREAALQAHLQRFARALVALSPSTQAEVDQLLTILSTAPGRRLLAGLEPPWHQAPRQAVDAALQSMRTSGTMLRRQAYHALRDLTQAAYFSDPGTWAALGYPGPRPLTAGAA
jgi:hypothetical protein